MVAGEDSAFGLVRANEDYSVSTEPCTTRSIPTRRWPPRRCCRFLKTGVYPVLNPTNFTPAQQFISTIKRFNHGGPFSYQWNGAVGFRARPLYNAVGELLRAARDCFCRAPSAATSRPPISRSPMAEPTTPSRPARPCARTLNPLISPLSFFYDVTGAVQLSIRHRDAEQALQPLLLVDGELHLVAHHR